jgi:hypothetical protein
MLLLFRWYVSFLITSITGETRKETKYKIKKKLKKTDITINLLSPLAMAQSSQ